MAQVLGQRVAGAERAARVALVERALGLEVGLGPEEVEAGREVALQEVGLGEAELDLLAALREGEAGGEILAAAEQVALAQADVAEHAVRGRVAGAERELAGRLLGDVDVDDHPVGGAALLGADVDRLEEAEVAQALLRAAQQGGVEGVALGDPELAPDHLVQRADVAAHVDPLDVDPRALARSGR